MRRYELLCEERLAVEIETLAREHDLTQEAVIRQLLDAGLDEVDGERHSV
jgi:2-iminoacetate synthase ThiH